MMLLRRSSKVLLSKAAWCAYNTYRKGLRYRRRLSRAAFLLDAPRESIFAFQRERLQRLFDHASETVPYYQKHLRRGALDISEVPPLEKGTVQTELPRLCSTLFPARKRIQNATGGSTGAPLTFYQDRHYWNERNLSVYYFDRWAGWDFGMPQLIVWGSRADVEGVQSWKVRFNNFWRNQSWLNGFRLTQSAMHLAYEQMARWHPETILAYPSSLYQYAKFLSENGLKVQWKLKGIICSAEMLYGHYRALTERVFNTKVYNRYGGREVGLIAMECAAGRLHINCRDVYLEIDSPSPYTEPGEILITQLNNYAMPFIRYRIGDIGRLSEEVCPCGNELPVLAELLGRTTATFRTKAGTLIHGGYFTQQFYNLAGVSQFQLIQETLEQCTLKLVINTEWEAATEYYIVQKIRDALGGDVTVAVAFVEDIPVSASGKRAFTISKVARQDS